MKLLILDNYDSFTWNLVHLVKDLGYRPEVVRNNKIALEKVQVYDKILLSPGPGIPREAGIMMELIRQYAASKSILGVCLGHQGIGEAFGGTLENMDVVCHGLTTTTIVKDVAEPLFKEMPKQFTACRYHSWVVSPIDLPEDLKVTAVNDEDRIMALAHTRYDVRGVQFHPESFLTEYGSTMLSNWLKS